MRKAEGRKKVRLVWDGTCARPHAEAEKGTQWRKLVLREPDDGAKEVAVNAAEQRPDLTGGVVRLSPTC